MPHEHPNDPVAPRIRFDRNEFAGSFGDIGTDLPLIILMIVALGLDSASVFIMFGLMQILTGISYRLPMPMQPLKAMALIVITASAGDERLTPSTLYAAGFAIGAVMLVLSLSGSLSALARWIPHCVVRGIQFGLGLKLASLALTTHVTSMAAEGYALAAVCFIIAIALWGNRRWPAALWIIGIGAGYALITGIVQPGVIMDGVGVRAPQWQPISWSDIPAGFLLLALPQLPLSLSNSVIATRQTIVDLFPERHINVRRIGLTYAVANLLNPFFGGIPVCHGSGGLAGHHTFGARTGGSVVIYGTMFVLLGALFSGAIEHVVQVFPRPVLGVVLLCEALVLMRFIQDVASSRRDLTIALLVGLIALTLPQGFVIGIVIGTAIHYAADRFHWKMAEHP